MKNKIKQQILNLVKENGILRPRDLDSLGIPREYLKPTGKFKKFYKIM